EQLESRFKTNTIVSARWLVGELDIAALRESVARLVARHESLRTTFVSRDGVPMQRVGATGGEGGAEVALEGVALGEAGEVEARPRLQDHARQPFDLEQGPLVRAGVFSLGDRRHLVWIRLHHIIGDAMAFRVIWRELEALYEALARGEEP